jgi:hypothetical protein
MASHFLTAENAENAEKTQKELNLFVFSPRSLR